MYTLQPVGGSFTLEVHFLARRNQQDLFSIVSKEVGFVKKKIYIYMEDKTALFGLL